MCPLAEETRATWMLIPVHTRVPMLRKDQQRLEYGTRRTSGTRRDQEDLGGSLVDSLSTVIWAYGQF